VVLRSKATCKIPPAGVIGRQSWGLAGIDDRLKRALWRAHTEDDRHRRTRWALSGTTAFTWITPATSPGAGPEYCIEAVVPPIATLTG
jgi:hypothetical protein